MAHQIVVIKVVNRGLKPQSAPNQTCSYIQSLKPGKDVRHWGGGYCTPPLRVLFTSGAP
jgi:hypothetical protein